MSYYNQQSSSYPGSNNEQSSYPGGGSGFPSADTRGAIGYPGQGQQPSGYPGQGQGYSSGGPDYGNNNQSSYPGSYGPGYGNSQGQYGSGPDYGASSQSYYSGAPSGPGYQSPQNGQEQQVQYDENGNPLPSGERGIGTMALGAVGGETNCTSIEVQDD
jgi:hypothetical protein